MAGPLSNEQIGVVKEAYQRYRLTDEKVAREFESRFNHRIDRSRVNRIIRGTISASAEIRERLETILQLPVGTLTARAVPTLFFGHGAPTEIKNVIVDLKTSDALIKGGGSTFADAVRNTQSIAPLSIESKLKTRPDGFSYTHFFQPSCIFVLKWDGGPWQILGYKRVKMPPRQQFRLLGGISVLWGASYEFNSDRHSSHPMDRWLKSVAEREPDASSQFTAGPECVFLKLLAYKLRLPSCKHVQLKPLGIVTNNLIPEKGCAYTQYVFRADVELTEKPKDLQSLSVINIPLLWIGKNEDPSRACVDERERLLGMDVAALLGLKSKTKRFKVATATFTPGFSII